MSGDLQVALPLESSLFRPRVAEQRIWRTEARVPPTGQLV